MLTDEQLAVRKTRISATDMGALIGVNPWKSAADVQAEKLFDLAPLASNEAIEIGHMLESPLGDWALGVLGDLRGANVGTVIHPDYPQICATPDVPILAKARGIECKTAGIVNPFHISEEWGEAGSSDVPAQHFAQVQTQMACTGWHVVYLAALIAGRGRVLYEIPRSPDDIEALIEIAVRWHEKHIVNAEPVPDDVPCLDVLKRVRRIPEKVADVPAQLHADLLTAKAALKAAELAEDHARSAYLYAIGDAEAGECELGMFTYFRQSRSGIDLEQLRSEFPAAAEACKKVTSFPVLREKKAPARKKGLVRV